MTSTNILLLYASDVAASARFYADLLGIQHIEASPTFALLILPSGLALGLWGKDGVVPAPIAAGGGSEIGFKMDDATAIDRTYTDWSAKGVTIALPPIDLEFGRSFVALDPDGHRLRIYAAAEDM